MRTIGKEHDLIKVFTQGRLSIAIRPSNVYLQHVGQGFPLDWITHTFNKMALAMSALAIALGPVATLAHDFGGGTLGPFKISLALIGINSLQLIGWRRDANKALPAFADTARLANRAWNAVASGGDVALITAAQACFEGATFAFALLWTPLLKAAVESSGVTAEPPWGLAFSQQLACVMIGSVLFKLTATSAGASAELMCFLACLGGAICFAALATGSTLAVVQAALLGYECCVGVYLNAMGVVRTKYVPQEVRSVVYSLIANRVKSLTHHWDRVTQSYLGRLCAIIGSKEFPQNVRVLHLAKFCAEQNSRLIHPRIPHARNHTALPFGHILVAFGIERIGSNF